MLLYLGRPDRLSSMAFTWPDPISLAADAVTFVGIPTLAWSTWKLWQDRKRDRAEETARRIDATHQEIVSQGCVDFEDTRERAAINWSEPQN